MSRRSVLVVEDNREFRETLKDLFELQGYQVHTAENGEDGLRCLDMIPTPCLIVLDLMMPVMDGWEFLDALRQHPDPATRAIPVVVVSGVADTFDLADLRSLYDCNVIRKPPELDALFAIARRSCDA
ncbi:MAG TPA: response regulator [Lysobacter sp.]|nr:response regulator [Lysobacter sp.]